jgi:hypothetical protein
VASLVVAIAVELNGKAARRPAAVDVSAIDAAVGLGQGEPGLTNTCNEGGLEFAEAHGLVSPEDASQSPGPRPVVAAGEDDLDRVRSDPIPNGCLVKGASKVGGSQDTREVDDGSPDVGHRDATPTGRVHQLSAANALGGHSADPALRRGENFGQ